MIDDLHTTWIMLQLHMPIVQTVNHLRGYPKPSRLGVELLPCPQCPTPKQIAKELRGHEGQKLMLHIRHA